MHAITKGLIIGVVCGATIPAALLADGEKRHDSFGRKGLVAETWDLVL